MSEKQKLLIADDSELNRDILKEILGSRYDYMEAENGTQAIQILEVHPEIDLMLLDINMPPCSFSAISLFSSRRIYSYTSLQVFIIPIISSSGNDPSLSPSRVRLCIITSSVVNSFRCSD